jgi:hypothetical protein
MVQQASDPLELLVLGYAVGYLHRSGPVDPPERSA